MYGAAKNMRYFFQDTSYSSVCLYIYLNNKKCYLAFH